MLEVEMKFLVSHNSVLGYLKNKGKFIEKIEQEDSYYDHPSRNYSLTDEALRLRKVDNKLELTYKGPKMGKKAKTRVELNTVVELNMIEMLDLLGFKRVAKVIKKRQVWSLDNIEICLDNVTNLGEFIELELIIEDECKIDDAIEQLRKVAISIGIDPENQIIDSYLNLLLKKQ